MDNIIKYAIADGNLQEKAEEVKENKEDVLSVKQENPQFTPCQEHYSCKWSWDETQFAQEEPIEDKIELLPPHEFSYDSQTEFEMIVMQRLELLTNALNQLIAKQK